MFNPTRRNRNIGTAKQGHGQSNRLTIPGPCTTSKTFYERLESYERTEIKINGHDFIFVVEQTRKNCKHACSIEDISRVLENIPSTDIGELKLIILRQPKRKEEILSPTWGRLIYSYEFENDFFPAIIVEAVNYSRKLKWSKSLSVDEQKELERLKADGHKFDNDGRNCICKLLPEKVRTTQLYRTLFHEVGHYAHYLEFVERQGTEEEAFEGWENRNDMYFKIAQADREAFAHRYADELRQSLFERQLIPFDPL